MPTMTLTARGVAAIETAPRGRVEYWDVELPGFGLRVSEHGRKTWTVMYRHEGRLWRLTIGTYPVVPLADARLKANDVLHAVARGEDPATEKRIERMAETVAELADIYIERHAKPNKRSWETDQRILKRDVIPGWGSRKIKDIKRRDVIAWSDHLLGRGGSCL
ncbi:MAG: integrase arm-type DNA-binding domain-containing protein [Hyphomicrobiales bacterium]